jgi:hypothetical protein
MKLTTDASTMLAVTNTANQRQGSATKSVNEFHLHQRCDQRSTSFSGSKSG